MAMENIVSWSLSGVYGGGGMGGRHGWEMNEKENMDVMLAMVLEVMQENKKEFEERETNVQCSIDAEMLPNYFGCVGTAQSHNQFLIIVL